MKTAGPVRIADILSKWRDIPSSGTTVPGRIPLFILTDLLEIRFLVLQIKPLWKQVGKGVRYIVSGALQFHIVNIFLSLGTFHRLLANKLATEP